MVSNKKSKTSGLDSLEFSANLFQFRDWDYTRQTNLKAIRYTKSHDIYSSFSKRFKRALSWAFGRTPDWIKQLEGKSHSISTRIHMALHSLKSDPNLPDGILDGGNIITFWEETGEYLSLMQPTVGSLLAKFLREEPENPHAIIINKELNRLQRRMQKRWNNGEITGEKENV